MSDILNEIKKAQKEIREEGRAGWGNLLDEVITEIERLRSHRAILAMHMAEVKALSDGNSENTLADIVSHCLQEINELPPQEPK